jgi:GTP-binding protein HflX
MNRLTAAGVLVEDKLFATLDPTTRQLRLPGGREALLTDTVGFIRKLPHDLVAAFRATLEGIEEASLILHVVDGSHPHAGEQVGAVDRVLASLDVASTPQLVVWNKTDLLPDPAARAVFVAGHENSLSISARTGEGLPELLARVEAMLGESLEDLQLLIPYDRWELVRAVFERGTVTSREDTVEGIRMSVSVPASLVDRLSPYLSAGDARSGGSGS